MTPIRKLLNLALTPWGREGHFFPTKVVTVYYIDLFLFRYTYTW